jgi:hypothetical protein
VNILSGFSKLLGRIFESAPHLFHPTANELTQATHDRHHTPTIDPANTDVEEPQTK